MKKITCLFFAAILILCSCNNENPKEPASEKIVIKNGVKVVGVILEFHDDGTTNDLPASTKTDTKVYLYDAEKIRYIETANIDPVKKTFEFPAVESSMNYRIVVDAEITDTNTGKVTDEISGMTVFEKPSSTDDTLSVLLPAKEGLETSDVIVHIEGNKADAAKSGSIDLKHPLGKGYHGDFSNGVGKLPNGLFRKVLKREAHTLVITPSDGSKTHTLAFKGFGLNQKSRTLVKVKL